MKEIDKREILLILIVIILGIFIALNLFKNDKVIFIKDHDYLYEKAIDSLLKNDNNIDKNKEHYKKFIAYKKFGIAEDKKNIYAYMWIVSEAYYVEDNDLKKSISDSMPYKFIFDRASEKLINYEIPEDGNQNKIKKKNMFPKIVQDEIINYDDDSNLQEEVDAYYKDILNE